MVTAVFFHKMFLHLVNRTPDHGKRKHTFYDIIVNMFSYDKYLFIFHREDQCQLKITVTERNSL